MARTKNENKENMENNLVDHIENELEEVNFDV